MLFFGAATSKAYPLSFPEKILVLVMSSPSLFFREAFRSECSRVGKCDLTLEGNVWQMKCVARDDDDGGRTRRLRLEFALAK